MHAWFMLLKGGKPQCSGSSQVRKPRWIGENRKTRVFDSWSRSKENAWKRDVNLCMNRQGEQDRVFFLRRGVGHIDVHGNAQTSKPLEPKKETHKIELRVQKTSKKTANNMMVLSTRHTSNLVLHFIWRLAVLCLCCPSSRRGIWFDFSYCFSRADSGIRYTANGREERQIIHPPRLT